MNYNVGKALFYNYVTSLSCTNINMLLLLLPLTRTDLGFSSVAQGKSENRQISTSEKKKPSPINTLLVIPVLLSLLNLIGNSKH